QYDDAVYKL
nr:Chain C, HLA-Cw4-specific peptide1IM9_G Chain G, HLA-Cw4-specific peptide1QQD_C Chain C, HLA-CW4 SPECIFIC PEPTIDE [synthetic construct]